MDVKPRSRTRNGSLRPGALRRSQTQRRSEAVANLLAAAAKLIAQSGHERVSLAQIGHEAGYSRGLVNHHFGSKARLIERLVESVQQEFEAAARVATASGSPLDRILGLVRTFLGMLDDLEPIHRAFLVLWAGALVAPREIREAMARSDRVFRDAIVEVLEEGDRRGIIREDVDALGYATMLVGQLRGVSLQVLIDPAGVDLERTLREIERSTRCALRDGLASAGRRIEG